MTYDEIEAMIEMEGFDYFFRNYVRFDDLPGELKPFVANYLKAGDELEAKLRKMGINV